MNPTEFINNLKHAFGENVELPIAFWFSDAPINTTEKVSGCLFKFFKNIRAGVPVSMNGEILSCGGGRFYAGFSDMPERVPHHVSKTERYKQSPQMVLDFLNQLCVPKTDKAFLNFARIDSIESFDKIEGILFLSTADILSGLATWAYYDNNADDTVSTIFGSGCSSVITQAVIENQKNGRRTFVGFLDPSMRLYFEAEILSFVIPMSRFKEMYYTMKDSALFDTPAWGKIRQRINDFKIQQFLNISNDKIQAAEKLLNE